MYLVIRVGLKRLFRLIYVKLRPASFLHVVSQLQSVLAGFYTGTLSAAVSGLSFSCSFQTFYFLSCSFGNSSFSAAVSRLTTFAAAVSSAGFFILSCSFWTFTFSAAVLDFLYASHAVSCSFHTFLSSNSKPTFAISEDSQVFSWMVCLPIFWTQPFSTNGSIAGWPCSIRELWKLWASEAAALLNREVAWGGTWKSRVQHIATGSSDC